MLGLHRALAAVAIVMAPAACGKVADSRLDSTARADPSARGAEAEPAPRGDGGRGTSVRETTPTAGAAGDSRDASAGSVASPDSAPGSKPNEAPPGPRGGAACELVLHRGGGSSCDQIAESPFACVRFNESCSIDVQLVTGGPWYGLAGIEGICIESITEGVVRHCSSGEEDWKERIAESPGDALGTVGRRLESTVNLDLIDLSSGEVFTASTRATAEKREETQGCWHHQDRCFNFPPGPFRPEVVPWPPGAEGQCDRICAHLANSCPAQFGGFCHFTCNYEADVAYSWARTRQFIDYVDCCMRRDFSGDCGPDGSARFGFGYCDDEDVCVRATPNGTEP